MTLRGLLLIASLLAREPHELPEARDVRLEAANTAMLRAAGVSRDLYAALLVLGGLETGFAERFARNGCRPGECDRGRAKHYWQAHRSSCPALWRAPTDVGVAARCAANMLRFGRSRCGTWAGAFCVYGALGCDCELGKRRAALRARVARQLGAGGPS